MKKHTWEVWTEQKGQEDKILFRGSRTNALRFYKRTGGSRAGLHLGYPLSQPDGPIADSNDGYRVQNEMEESS